jgi:hypothetical protein
VATDEIAIVEGRRAGGASDQPTHSRFQIEDSRLAGRATRRRFAVAAKHYGFTDEELDFIIHYDIEYRMGRGAGEESEVLDMKGGATNIYQDNPRVVAWRHSRLSPPVITTPGSAKALPESFAGRRQR